MIAQIVISTAELAIPTEKQTKEENEEIETQHKQLLNLKEASVEHNLDIYMFSYIFIFLIFHSSNHYDLFHLKKIISSFIYFFNLKSKFDILVLITCYSFYSH